MGAREDFDRALRQGNFAAAARAWATGNDDLEGGQAFESKLRAGLKDRDYVVGESLSLADGEYTYLGNRGTDGNRIAYMPSTGSLNRVTYFRDHDELLGFLEAKGAPSLDIETVIAFYALSEREALGLSQPIEQVFPQERQGAAPTVANVKAMMPEDALRAMLSKAGDSHELIEAMVEIAKRDVINDRVHVGSMYAYGQAPYKNEPGNSQNFFVSLVRPDEQEETIWGKELEAALAKEGLNNGAAVDVILAHQGMKAVTVREPEVDEHGKRTGRFVDVPAHRNQWKATSLEQLRQEAQELLTERAYDGHMAAKDADELPAQLADFRKTLQNATWFFDGTETEVERVKGQQSLSQVREDFKALMVNYPEEAAEVWRAEAPAEYQPEMSDLLAQLESAAPVVIKAHQDHEQDEARQQEALTSVHVPDAIQPAPAAATREEVEEAENSIQSVPMPAGDKLARHDDAILRVAGGTADSISNAGKVNRAASENEPGLEDATIPPSPKTLLNGRFVLRDHGQYFRVADGVESARVALVDEVNKIRFVDKQMDAFQAAIELAKHKQWEAILVTGSEKFRAEAWHHARMAGLEVVGYEPTEKDLATLKAAQERSIHLPQAKGIAVPEAEREDAETVKSLKAAKEHALGEGYGVTEPKAVNGRHVGKVIHETDQHIVQDVGRKVAVVHEKDSFDRQALRAAMEKGTPLKIQYAAGRAVIEGGKDRAQERGR